MTKLQIGVLLGAMVLLGVLYFGFDRKPQEIRAAEKTRSLEVESTNISVLLKDAKENLKVEDSNTILVLEQQLATQEDSTDTSILKELSGAWYRIGEYAISGYYAQQVAEKEDTEQAWSIAGTSYAICVQRSETEKVKEYCTNRAANAFENATSIAPDNSQHKVNLSLVYVENPPAENPMKGIQMLLDLNRNNPNDVLVLLTLAKQGMRTGQFEKASERLQKVLSIQSDNIDANCLLAQIYEQLGQLSAAQPYIEKCKVLSSSW